MAHFRLPTILVVLLLGGCAAGDGTLDEVDPAAAPANPTWSDPVQRVVDVYCAGCHSDDGAVGAQEGYAFDTCDQVKRARGAFQQATFENESMPPPAGFVMPEAAKLTMKRWFAQGMPCD
ncbi:MAG: hypothetical protein KC583_02415 [Myxococcales bacterium]|nr:hypothetical protein [Myxococcales bacterium]